MNNMISVSEYAQLTGKDPGNIRKMLAAGRLEGAKVGNQWVIPSDAKYPDDKRTRSGKYRNWRKKVQLNSNKELMGAVRELVDEFVRIYSGLLREVVIYGSYARGEQTEESDVDIALILEGEPSSEMTDRMIDVTATYELKTDKVLSVIDIAAEKYDYWKNAVPFYRNIEKEGIVLWKAA